MYRNKHKLSLKLFPITQDSAVGDLDVAPFVPKQNIVQVKQGKLCLSEDRMNITLVQKKGKKTITTEIKIYNLIASNKHSEKKAIIRPIFNNIKGSSLLFPLMPGGNLDLPHNFLFKLVKAKKNVATSWLMKQLFLLLEALHHLHTETFFLESGHPFTGIIHGDIKPSNILINELGNLVLADFDCAYPAVEPARQFGSLRYMAPELFSTTDFTIKPLLNINKSDIWSLGITLYRLLNNKLPVFFNSFTSSQKKSAHHFFQEKIGDKDNYCTLLKDNIGSFIDLKKWGENYSSSFMANKAKKSLEFLQHNKENNEAHLTQSDILNHLSIAMLGSIEDRPNAERLLTLMQVFQKHFSSANENESQQFITELLSQSSLNRACVDKNLNPEMEFMNKKVRSFS
ncbi:MAG: hypothetical protein RJA83_454 [Pseudomonadota bacterium]|jgi:serine/threonine protein kinase